MTKEESNSLFNKYFKLEKDNSITFLGEKLKIIIPEKYVEKDIAHINNNFVESIGIFEGYIFDDMSKEDINEADHSFVLKAPDMLYLDPAHVERIAMTVNDPINDVMKREFVYELTFLQGDTYIKDVNSVQDLGTADAMLGMVMNAQMPKSITYEDYLTIWDKCNRRNKAKDLNVTYNILAMIVSELIRTPDDMTKPFRLNFEKYYSKGIMNGKPIRAFDVPRFTNNFSSLTGADTKHGITVAMEQSRVEKRKDTPTPIEINIQ